MLHIFIAILKQQKMEIKEKHIMLPSRLRPRPEKIRTDLGSLEYIMSFEESHVLESFALVLS